MSRREKDPSLIGGLTKPRGEGGPVQLGQIPLLQEFAQKFKPPTPIQQRLIDAAAAHIENPDHQSILYQHSVLCQTYLPYRNPGDDMREWDRLNGDVHLEVRAGKAMHPIERRLVKVGLPYGPKCRLVLMHINQLAILSQSPRIEVQDSLTAFVRRVLNLDPKGRNIKEVKAQLSRLAAADMTLGIAYNDPATATLGASTDHLRVIRHHDLWLTKDENQRLLWPSTIDLSQDYFQSLMHFAVPLNETHIAALSHNALALDIYAWLAQRLHRIPPNKPAFVSWAALHGQFGQGYTGNQAIKKFRSVFRHALKEVLTLYKDARVDDEDPKPPRLYSLEGGRTLWRAAPATGLTLRNSSPPVRKLYSTRRAKDEMSLSTTTATLVRPVKNPAD